MYAIDNLKKRIEETREELNKLVVTEKFENYYALSLKLDALIEEYLDANEMAIA